MKIIAVTQARMGSTRLPNKILKKVGNKTLLDLHVQRIQQATLIDELVIATTVQEADVKIAEFAKNLNLPFYRGSENDVLDRFYQAVKDKKPDYVVRLTSDCPLIDATLIDKAIKFVIDNGLDYGSNTLNPTYPDGQDVEVFKFQALEQAWNEATLLSDREHVTPYIWRNSSFKEGTLFKSGSFEEGYSYGHLRMTVDEPKDYNLILNIVEQLGIESTWLEYAEFIDKNPDILAINAGIIRNEGLTKSLKKDKQNG